MIEYFINATTDNKGGVKEIMLAVVLVREVTDKVTFLTYILTA